MILQPFVASLAFCIDSGFDHGLRALSVTFSASRGALFLNHDPPRRSVQKTVCGMFTVVMDHVDLVEDDLVLGMLSMPFAASEPAKCLCSRPQLY